MEKLKITITVVKANVGSIGNAFTRLHDEYNNYNDIDTYFRNIIERKNSEHMILDALVTWVKNSAVFILSHTFEIGSEYIKRIYEECINDIRKKMNEECGYGVNKNHQITVAELEIGINFKNPERSFESFCVLIGDECVSRTINFALYRAFANPLENKKLLRMNNIYLPEGFVVHLAHRKQIPKYETEHEFDISEEKSSWPLLEYLEQLSDNIFIEKIFSNHTKEQIASFVYSDSFIPQANSMIGIIRTEDPFVPLNEIVKPYNSLPLAPLPFETEFTDPYQIGTISCLAFSMNQPVGRAGGGNFSGYMRHYGGYVDVFKNPAWEAVRLRIQRLMYENRLQGISIS